MHVPMRGRVVKTKQRIVRKTNSKLNYSGMG